MQDVVGPRPANGARPNNNRSVAQPPASRPAAFTLGLPTALSVVTPLEELPPISPKEPVAPAAITAVALSDVSAVVYA